MSAALSLDGGSGSTSRGLLTSTSRGNAGWGEGSGGGAGLGCRAALATGGFETDCWCGAGGELASLSLATLSSKGSFTAAYAETQANASAPITARVWCVQTKNSQQLKDLYDKIMGREKFQYDAANDPLYQQYRQMYVQQGRQAMADTKRVAGAEMQDV